MLPQVCSHPADTMVCMHADVAVCSLRYALIERKIFSLPKLALLPSVVMRHPRLSLLGLPLAVLVDGAKSWLTTKLTMRIEEHRRNAKAIGSKVAKIDAYDLQHAAQITSEHLR